VHHPLQPFDRRNFTPGALCGESSWSYDRVNLNGSLAAATQEPARPWLDGPLPALEEPVLQLEYLVNFVEHPVRAFLRRRLGLYLSNRSDQLLDGVPLELDSLEKWGVGDRLLQASLAGTDVTRAARAERARGLLPPESLADSVLREVSEQVDALANAVEGLGFQPGPADSVDIHVDLPDGRTLIGTVPNVRDSTLVHCTYSRLAPKHRLAAWVRFLALSAARPDLPVGAVTIGRGQRRQPPRVARLHPLGTTASRRRAGALAALDDLLYLYDLALRRPVPLACATSAAWAEALHSGLSDDAYQRAEAEWKDGLFPGEISDPEHVYVWGRATSLADLMADPPDPDDNRPEWTADETTRFAALARRLWSPLLHHEERDR
jgi:exodeoxyribonuclease V gamma subunit